MAFDFPFLLFLFSFVVLISSATSCDRCLHQSKASYFSSPSSISDGACGYGSLALGINRGFIASASPSLYRDGVGCGACFQYVNETEKWEQIRCKDAKLCNTKGATIVVTDQHTANDTNFMLNTPAFLALAKSGSAQTLKEAQVTDIEYRRVPCNYKNKNLSIRVEEGSQKPNNLTVKVLFQGGQTDIKGIDVARFGISDWRFMTRSKTHGAVWTTDRAPTGPLQFRFIVTGGYDGKWVWAEKEVLPLDWKVGMVYDTGLQITDVAQEGCASCDTHVWT